MLQVARQFELSKKQQAWESKTEKAPISSKYIDIYNTQDKFRVVYADPAWSYNDKQNIPNLVVQKNTMVRCVITTYINYLLMT